MEKPEICNVLVVEDDDNSYLYLLFALEARKCNVYRAADGLEAINLFKEGQIQFDLVLMDLKLPKLDGYQATSEIKKICADIPVILQTATYMNNESQKLLDYKIDALLLKPFTVNALVDAMQTVFEIKNFPKNSSNQNFLLQLQ